MEQSIKLEEFICEAAGLVDLDFDTEMWETHDGTEIHCDFIAAAACEINHLLQIAYFDRFGTFLGDGATVEGILEAFDDVDSEEGDRLFHEVLAIIFVRITSVLNGGSK